MVVALLVQISSQVITTPSAYAQSSLPTVYGTVESSVPRAIIQPSFQDGDIGEFRISAPAFDIVVKELGIVNLGADVTGGNITAAVSSTLNHSIDGSIVSVVDGSTTLGYGYIEYGVAKVVLNQPLAISQGTSKLLTIRLRNQLPINGANETNRYANLGILDPGQTITNPKVNNAVTRILKSGTTIALNGEFDNWVIGGHVYRKSMFRVTPQTQSDTSVNNLLTVAGQGEAVLFSTIASTQWWYYDHRAAIKQIAFKVSSQGVPVDNFKLKINDNVLSESEAQCVSNYSYSRVICEFRGTYNEWYQINAWTSAKIELIARVWVSTDSKDTIKVQLLKMIPDDFRTFNATEAKDVWWSIIRSDIAEGSVATTVSSHNWFTEAWIVNSPGSTWSFTRNLALQKNIFVTRTDTLSDSNILTNTSDILALKANINTATELSVEKFKIFYMWSGVEWISIIKMYVRGLLIDQIDVNQLPTATSWLLEFAYFGNLSAWSNDIEIKIDTKEGYNFDGKSIKFAIGHNVLVNAVYLPSNTPVSHLNVEWVIYSANLTIRNAGVEYITKSYSANPQIAYPWDDITAIKFVIKANSMSDLVVNSFDLNIPFFNNSKWSLIDARVLIDTGVNWSTVLDLETIAITNSGRNQLTFDWINVVIPASTSKEFTIMVRTTNDLAGLFPTSINDLQFSVFNFFIDTVDWYPVMNLNNTDSVYGNQIDIVENVKVTAHKTSVEQSTILASTSSYPQPIWSFEIWWEANMIISEITLANLINNVDEVTSQTILNNLNSSTDGSVIELYYGNSFAGSAQLLNGLAYIALTQPISIVSWAKANINVVIRTNTVISSARDTNKVFKIGVLSPWTINSGLAQTLITTLSGQALKGGFKNLIFNNHYLRATTITFADQDWINVSNNNLISIAGQNQATIFRTIVSTNSSKSANIKQLKFKFAHKGVSVTNFKLNIDNIVLNTWDATCNLASDMVTCVFNGLYINGLKIEAGASKVVRLIADVSVSTSDTDYIITSINEGSPQNFMMYDASSATAVGASVVWSDNAAPNVTVNDVNWFTDAGIEKLPSNSWTFTRDSGPVNNEVVISNAIFIPSSTWGNQSLILWSVSQPSKVKIQVRASNSNESYSTITTTNQSAESALIYFDRPVGWYTFKLTPVDDLGTPVWLDTIFNVNYKFCVDGQINYPICDTYNTGSTTWGLTITKTPNPSWDKIIHTNIWTVKVMQLNTQSDTQWRLNSIKFKLTWLVNRNHISLRIEWPHGELISYDNKFNTNFESTVYLTGYQWSWQLWVYHIYANINDSVNEQFTISIESLDSFETNQKVTAIMPMTSQLIKTVMYVPMCGNLYIDNNEQCDDGNMVNGDGCSNSCVIEPSITKVNINRFTTPAPVQTTPIEVVNNPTKSTNTQVVPSISINSDGSLNITNSKQVVVPTPQVVVPTPQVENSPIALSQWIATVSINPDGSISITRKSTIAKITNMMEKLQLQLAQRKAQYKSKNK